MRWTGELSGYLQRDAGAEPPQRPLVDGPAHRSATVRLPDVEGTRFGALGQRRWPNHCGPLPADALRATIAAIGLGPGLWLLAASTCSLVVGRRTPRARLAVRGFWGPDTA